MSQFKYWTVEKVVGTNLWEVDKPFIWLIDYEKPSGWAVVLEKWFRTDYGSIPRVLWLFLSPTKYNAYLIHDKLYSTHYFTHIASWTKKSITRIEADKLLIKILEYEGASFFEKLFIYAGVRIGWFWWWNS